MARRYDQKELPVAWLDKLTMRRMDKMQLADQPARPSDEGKVRYN